MDRRAFLCGLAAYSSMLVDARAQGTSRVPKLKIREIRAARMRDINSRFVRVYTDQGLTKEASDLVRRSGVRGIKTAIDNITQKDNDAGGLDPGTVWNWTLTNKQIDDIVYHVAAMREALGPDVGLMLECHTRYDTESAIQIAKAVEPYRPMWMEEPVPSDNVDAMATVRNHRRVPIACGENVYSRFGFRPFLERQAVSIIQPDMAKCGGLWEGRKIAAMSEVYHIPIAPHGVATTLGKVAYAHVCSRVPNFMILEGAHYGQKNYEELTTAAD